MRSSTSAQEPCAKLHTQVSHSVPTLPISITHVHVRTTTMGIHKHDTRGATLLVYCPFIHPHPSHMRRDSSRDHIVRHTCDRQGWSIQNENSPKYGNRLATAHLLAYKDFERVQNVVRSGKSCDSSVVLGGPIDERSLLQEEGGQVSSRTLFVGMWLVQFWVTLDSKKDGPTDRVDMLKSVGDFSGTFLNLWHKTKHFPILL